MKEDSLLFWWAGQEVVVVFLFNLNSCQGESRQQGSRPKYWLLNMLWYRGESPLSASRTNTNALLQIGVFLHHAVPNHISSTKPGRGQGYRMETFFEVSKACVKSPTEAQRTEIPMGQWLLSVSQQDMVKHKLNDVWLQRSHLCALTTLMPLLVSAGTYLFLAAPVLSSSDIVPWTG